MTRSGNLTAVLLAASMFAMSGAMAHAAGEAGGDAGAAGSDASTITTKCKTGMVWDPEAPRLFGKGKCVDKAEMDKKKPAEKQGQLYDYGKWLAKNGHFEDAIEVLASVPDQSDPRVLNYLGYSNRKLGRMETALGYYHAAVAANPDFSLVREYLGEAYIQLGMLEAAREQLTEIERICGSRSCGEYGQLAQMIVDSQM
jgi:tetratricopeptide (TPR) repeat protein